jgi:hypothetical protein
MRTGSPSMKAGTDDHENAGNIDLLALVVQMLLDDLDGAFAGLQALGPLDLGADMDLE